VHDLREREGGRSYKELWLKGRRRRGALSGTVCIRARDNRKKRKTRDSGDHRPRASNLKGRGLCTRRAYHSIEDQEQGNEDRGEGVDIKKRKRSYG